ncbi:MAG: hypothetical protein IJN80_02985, partial [Clostridia bacterium]|nr:hypothetical protein [Clostridia bacterium]
MVFQNNDYSSTATTVTSISMLAGTTESQSRVSFENSYTDEAVTANYQGGSTLSTVVGATAMTSGEAAYGANAAATADSLYWYTTTADGVALGTAANATRKVDIYVDGEIADTDYVNVDADYTVSYTGATSFAIKDGSAGSVDAATGKVTFGGNNDVAVVVTLGDDAAKAEAKAKLEETIKYFDDRNISYFVADAATELSDAKVVYGAAESEKEDYEDAEAALAAYKTQLLDTYPNVPNVKDVDLYPTLNNYTVANATDWMEVVDSYSKFNRAGVTIHLTGNVDLSESVASSFTGFASGGLFSLNGHGNTISNWNVNHTAQYTAIFKEYQGAYIGNLTLKNCHVGASYGSALLVGGYRGTGDATNKALVFENINIVDSSLTRTVSGQNQMGLIVSKDWGATNSMTFKNIKIINSDMLISDNAFCIQNAGFLIGSSNSSKSYIIEDIYVVDSTCDVNTAAAGGLVGSAEAGATYTFNNVGVFDSVFNTEQATTTAAVMVGTTTGNPTKFVFKNCIAAGITSDSDRIAWIKQLNTTRGTKDTAENCYSEFGNLYAYTPGVGEYHSGAAGAVEDTSKATAIAGIKTITQGDISSLMPAGEVNAALSDPAFYWTTNENGIEPGTAANATRKVMLEVNGEIEETYYVNVGDSKTLSYTGAASYALKDEGVGQIDGSVVTVNSNQDVTVVVTLDDSAAKEAAKAALAESIKYFTDRKMNYYVAAATTELNEAQAVLNNEASTKEDYETAKDELDAFKTQYASEKVNAPSISEMDLYPDAPVYVLREPADFQGLEEHKNSLTADDTVYMLNDIDMKGSTFAGVADFKASFDGQGYKIKNWGIAADGETKAAITTRGLFYNTYGAAAVIKSIKNLTFENCHTIASSIEDGSAILYGVGHVNAGMATEGSATTLDLINIHFNGCSIKVTAGKECIAFLLGRYAIQNEESEVNVTNCSVTNCEIDGSTATHMNGEATVYMGHASMLIGKARAAGTGSEDAIYNLKDCLISGNTIKSPRADAQYAGFVIGTAEADGNKTKVNMTNIGVFGNTFNNMGTATQTNLIGDVQSSIVTVNGLLVSGNTATGASEQSVVLFNGGANTTTEKVYCSDKLDKVATAGSAALAGDTVGGEAAWAANSVSGGNLWWTIDAENNVLKGTEDNATHKVEFRNQAEGADELVATFYTKADGKLLAEAAEVLGRMEYDWFLGEDEVTIDQVYTADTTVISTTVHHFEGGEIEHNDGTDTHKLLCTDSDCSVYKTVDCTVDSYTYKEVEGAHKHEAKCVCGNLLSTDDCDIDYTIADGDVHTEACTVCDYSKEAECVYTGWEHVIGSENSLAKHFGTCVCSDIKMVDCSFDEGVEITPAGKGTCGEIKYTCEVCPYNYTEKTAMLSDAALILDAANVNYNEEIKVTIKLNPDTYGVAGAKIVLTYDESLTLKENLEDKIDGPLTLAEVVEPGKIRVVLANNANITAETTILELTFNAINRPATLQFAAVATEGETFVGEDILPIEIAGATADVVVAYDHECVGEYEPVGDGKHQFVCTLEHCEVVYPEEACNSTLTPDSATTHKVYCSVCNDVQAEGVTCEFGDWAHVDGEKDTHKRECECGNFETG